jgi:hypothetical protein
MAFSLFEALGARAKLGQPPPTCGLPPLVLWVSKWSPSAPSLASLLNRWLHLSVEHPSSRLLSDDSTPSQPWFSRMQHICMRPTTLIGNQDSFPTFSFATHVTLSPPARLLPRLSRHFIGLSDPLTSHTTQLAGLLQPVGHYMFGILPSIMFMLLWRCHPCHGARSIAS